MGQGGAQQPDQCRGMGKAGPSRQSLGTRGECCQSSWSQGQAWVGSGVRAHRPWCREPPMDASAPGPDTMMYGEPEDIWISKAATLNRITNPDHVHNEAPAGQSCPGFLSQVVCRIVLGS